MRRHLKMVSLLAVCLLTACQGSPAPIPEDGRPAEYRLTILHTNDFHGNDYSLLARQAALIKKIRGEGKNVIYLDAGDVFTRGPHQEAFQGELEFAALNALGCQAMTLGNNEFKATGEPETARKILGERIRQAEFPVLSANITLTRDGSYLPGVRPYTVFELAGVKIGLLGLSAIRIKYDVRSRDLTVEEPLAAAKRIIPELARQADIILALTHLGFDVDCRLAGAGIGIQAVIGGDSHTILRKAFEVGSVPVVQAGDGGWFLGRLDLIFRLRNGKYVLWNYTGILIPIKSSLPEDPEMRALIDRFFEKEETKAS